MINQTHKLEMSEESICDDDIIISIDKSKENLDDDDWIECMDCVQRKMICILTILIIGVILLVFLYTI